MEIQPFKTEHYSELSSFWSQYGWVAPKEEVLPKKGFVAIYNGKIVAASFVYLSCSGMALLDWVIGNKQVESSVRGKAVYNVISACKDYAKEQDKCVLYTVTANQVLQEIYKKVGFKNMETNATTMAISLNGLPLDFLKE